MSSLRGIAYTTVALLGAVATLAACGGDGQQGIPTDTPSAPTTTTTTTTNPVTTNPVTTTVPASTTVAPPPGPDVGEVSGSPQAASALRAFLADLDSGGVPAVTPNCWTVPPSEIPVQYADVPAILGAAASPGLAEQDVVTWTGPTTALTVARSDIASGYACPRVHPAGTSPGWSEVDAEYTVERYLGRFTGTPVSPADLEGDHPVVCDNRFPWDPQGSGAPTIPPLANNPGRLTGSASYNPNSVYVAFVDGDYTTVYADVTNVSGFEQNQVFTLALRPSGYCIGDVA